MGTFSLFSYASSDCGGTLGSRGIQLPNGTGYKVTSNCRCLEGQVDGGVLTEGNNKKRRYCYFPEKISFSYPTSLQNDCAPGFISTDPKPNGSGLSHTCLREEELENLDEYYTYARNVCHPDFPEDSPPVKVPTTNTLMKTCSRTVVNAEFEPPKVEVPIETPEVLEETERKEPPKTKVTIIDIITDPNQPPSNESSKGEEDSEQVVEPSESVEPEKEEKNEEENQDSDQDNKDEREEEKFLVDEAAGETEEEADEDLSDTVD